MSNPKSVTFKYKVLFSSSFKKDYKQIKKRHFKIAKLHQVITLLANGETLPASYKNHKLSGKWGNYYECHIAPDWLLIYKRDQATLILTLTRTGTHADLF